MLNVLGLNNKLTPFVATKKYLWNGTHLRELHPCSQSEIGGTIGRFRPHTSPKAAADYIGNLFYMLRNRQDVDFNAEVI